MLARRTLAHTLNRCFFALANESAVVVERYVYDAYGQPSRYNALWAPRTGLSTVGNSYYFQSRRYDGESGLYHYRLRYLDPVVGRFITPDPIGAWGDAMNMGNPYSFVGNNPWTYRDPFGLWGIQIGDAGFNIGVGEPSLIFGEQAAIGANQGAAVVWDTLLPGTPWRDSGYYSNSDPGIWHAQWAAGIGVTSGAAAYIGAVAAEGAVASLVADAKLLAGGAAGLGAAGWQRLGPQACPRAASAVSGAERTRTVWDNVQATQPAIWGQSLPTSFRLMTANGNFWISPNAAKHILERMGYHGISFTTNIVGQTMLRSLQVALSQVGRVGLVYGKKYIINGWEIVIRAPRNPGDLPAVIHAVYKG